MIRILIAVLIFSISTAFSQNMTPEILLELKRISDVQVSPDGKQIIFTVTSPSIEKNSSTTDIFIMDINKGEPKRITWNGDHNFNPRWSPKGDKIAFLSDRNGKSQGYVMDMKGGEAQKMTDMENGIACFDWSPDGKWLSFVSDVKLEQTVTEIYPDLPDVNVHIADDLPVRHWDHYLDEKYSHLFVIPSEGGEPKDLMPGEKFDTPLKPFGGASDIAWSPKGTEIAYTCKKVPDFAFSTNSDIYTVSPFGGTPKNITNGQLGFDMHPVYSPDGSYIAFQSQERPGYESDRVRLMVYTKSSGRISEISNDVDQWVSNIEWASNSRELYFTAGNNDGTSQIYEIDLKGKFKILTKGDYNYGDRVLKAVPGGKELIISRRNYNRPTELFKLSLADNKISQITDINGEVFKNIKPARIEARWITSTDSSKVHSWVIYPPDFDPKKKYPLITYCQGGPQQAVSQFWSYGWNFLTMASKGYIIIAPNRRGCPGFGQKWVDAIKQDYGGMPMQDIMSAAKEMAKESYVDPNRIAAIGASAGGYAVFYLMGNHNGLFKSFISHCGMFNMESKYGSTEELWFPNWDNGGPFWEPEHKRFYEKNSPHKFVNNWNTPILIFTGEKDYRVPYTQSLEAFTAAKSKNVPARIVIFPDENHWILKFQEKLLWYREFFRFLELYNK